jgi:hypothetical protein
MTHTPVFLRYLGLPANYELTDGLRWAESGEAVETREGRTLVFAAQLATFLEGFTAQRPLVHVAYVLDVLRLLLRPEEPPEGIPHPLGPMVQRAFRAAGSSLRNAGAFFGLVCADVRSAHLPGHDYAALARWLTTASGPSPAGWENPEEPPLSPAAFRRLLAARLGECSEEAIRHWFRFGRGPLAREGDRLAEEVALAKPPASRATLDDLLRERPRLAGALPLVAALAGALSLPPRRRTPPELPLGGYADVTNRGEPERLLPSQFALDGDEFVRRFAERELLFFRREEPHRRTGERLVLLVDQGVRTWGVVRLALSAAVLAFRKLAERRRQPFAVRFGESAAEFHPGDCDPAALADRLEASDLSANPAKLLEAAASDADARGADFVLLTHPRSLADAGVRQAARGLPAGGRLFALAVEEDGASAFSEVRHGEAVPLSRFRLDFRATEVAPDRLPADDSQWTGDVEPVPFPFPIGPFLNVTALDFDADARHLLVGTIKGYLHLWDLENGRLETLPRALCGGALTKIDAILGMRCGFVVGGRFDSEFVAAHYDLARRTVKVHRFGPAELGQAFWCGFPDLHALAVRVNGHCHGLDLANGATYTRSSAVAEATSRAGHACLRALDLHRPPPWIPAYVVGNAHAQPERMTQPWLDADAERGTIRLYHRNENHSFHVTEDGKPVRFYGDCHAQFALGVVAFTACQHADRSQATWHLFAATPLLNPLADYEVEAKDIHLCRLAPNSLLFAMPTRARQITVRTVGEGATNRIVASAGKIHNNLVVKLGAGCMGIISGQKRHVLSWREGPLTHRYEDVPPRTVTPNARRDKPCPSHALGAPDPSRIVSVVSGDLDVLVDVAGQVVVYDRYRGRLVCIVRVLRGQFAAWMPDGTVYGPSTLTGRTATPGALERLGKALRHAASTEGGEP